MMETKKKRFIAKHDHLSFFATNIMCKIRSVICGYMRSRKKENNNAATATLLYVHTNTFLLIDTHVHSYAIRVNTLCLSLKSYVCGNDNGATMCWSLRGENSATHNRTGISHIFISTHIMVEHVQHICAYRKITHHLIRLTVYWK